MYNIITMSSYLFQIINILKWNILEGSIKPNVIHYNNISTIKDLNFKE